MKYRDVARRLSRLGCVELPRRSGGSHRKWNCKHLANANKFGHIRRVNGLLGLFTPSLVTPLELLGDNDDED